LLPNENKRKEFIKVLLLANLKPLSEIKKRHAKKSLARVYAMNLNPILVEMQMERRHAKYKTTIAI